MIRVNQRDLATADRYLWATEASSLGLRPGEWPNVIRVITEPGHESGGWLDLNREMARTDRDGDVVSVIYATPLGTFRLEVFND